MNLDKLLVELEGIGRIAKEWKMQRAIADIEREIVLAKLRDIYTEIKLGSAEIVGSAQTADNNTCEIVSQQLLTLRFLFLRKKMLLHLKPYLVRRSM